MLVLGGGVIAVLLVLDVAARWQRGYDEVLEGYKRLLRDARADRIRAIAEEREIEEQKRRAMEVYSRSEQLSGGEAPAEEVLE
ncbi:MAG: hypothetical protein CHACPFDD_00535 [Phycisphaerae bacterium]|nr:hypothetical protein [Phycisphaerae bacterium]